MTDAQPPHYHFVCNTCGEVSDLALGEDYFQKVNKIAGENFDGTIESHTTLFSGTCPKCMAERLNRKLQA